RGGVAFVSGAGIAVVDRGALRGDGAEGEPVQIVGGAALGGVDGDDEAQVRVAGVVERLADPVGDWELHAYPLAFGQGVERSVSEVLLVNSGGGSIDAALCASVPCGIYLIFRDKQVIAENFGRMH